MRLWLILLSLAVAAPAKPTKPVPKPTSTMPAKRAADPEAGQKLYEQSCVQCHGPSGKGDGSIAGDVVGGVPDLSTKIVQDDYAAALDVIQAGRGRMPAYSEVMDRQDSRRILVYLSEVLAGRIEPGKAGAEKPVEPSDDDEGN